MTSMYFFGIQVPRISAHFLFYIFIVVAHFLLQICYKYNYKFYKHPVDQT